MNSKSWSTSQNEILDGDKKLIATVSRQQDGYVQANLRLLSKAPDMLEMLKTSLGNAKSIRAAQSGNTYDVWISHLEALIKEVEVQA